MSNENSEKENMSENCDADSEHEFDLDEVLNIIKFGKFQVIVFFMISIPIFVGGIQYSYIFTAGTVKYRLLNMKYFNLFTF